MLNQLINNDMTERRKKICWMCLLIFTIGIAISLLIPACYEKTYDELKELPDVVYGGDGKRDVITRADLGFHFNYQRGRNFQELDIPKYVNIFMLDNKFREVDYYWFRKFNNWFKDLLFNNGMLALGDAGETFDCDNYAMMYKSLMSAAAYKAGEKTEPAAILLLVEQRNAFGGIPSGSLHLCVLIMTNQGWFVVEPQTGKFDKLENYPNQKYVRMMII
jgi:hypothetical protein